MIWLLSDLHGGESLRGFQEYLDAAGENDLLILLGDIGLKFADTEENRRFDKMFLSSTKNIAFLDGNHENFAFINSFPEEDWNGGRVHRLSDKIVHLKRGNIYTIEGKTFFVFGGCKSSPRWKQMGLWYPGEEPTPEELALAHRNLAARDCRVDYILTHKYEETPPKGTVCHDLQMLTVWLEDNVQYTHWYAGHWHKNCQVDAAHSVVYDNPVTIA